MIASKLLVSPHTRPLVTKDMREFWFRQRQVSPSSAPATVPEPGNSSLGLLLSVGNLETPMEGGLRRAVTEIPTRVRLCSQMNSCADQPPAPAQTQMWDGGFPQPPASYASQCHSAQPGPEVETGQTLSFNKHLMSTCSVPDALRGENKTNTNLILPGAVLPTKPPQPVHCRLCDCSFWGHRLPSCCMRYLGLRTSHVPPNWDFNRGNFQRHLISQPGEQLNLQGKARSS